MTYLAENHAETIVKNGFPVVWMNLDLGTAFNVTRFRTVI